MFILIVLEFFLDALYRTWSIYSSR